MENLVDIPVIAPAVAMLAAAAWAAITRTRVNAWYLTTALLWLGTASFAASALSGSAVGLVLMGWALTLAGLLAGVYALFGLPGGAKRPAPVEIRHVVRAR